MKNLIKLAIVLMSINAQAAVYKCGNTYQDHPCNSDSTSYAVVSTAPSTINHEDYVKSIHDAVTRIEDQRKEALVAREKARAEALEAADREQKETLAKLEQERIHREQMDAQDRQTQAIEVLANRLPQYNYITNRWGR